MSNNNYIPKLSYRETILYIDNFLKNFKKYYQEKFNVIDLELPLLTNINNSVDVSSSDLRTINFDNNNNDQIYQLIYNYNNLINYHIWNCDLNEKEIIFCKYKKIERDLSISPSETMEKNIISIHYVIKEEDRNINYLTSVAKNVVFAINEGIINSKKIYDVKKIPLIEQIYNILDIKKRYPLLSHKVAFERFVALKKCVAIYNVINEFTNSNITGYKDADQFDWDNTIGWYLFDENTQKPIEIFLVTISPNWQIYQKQKLIYDSAIENNDFIEKLKSENYPPIVSIKFNYDALIYLILKKNNINELPFVNNEYNLSEIYKFFNNKGDKHEK